MRSIGRNLTLLLLTCLVGWTLSALACFYPAGSVAGSCGIVGDATASVVQAPLQDPTPPGLVDFDSGESEMEQEDSFDFETMAADSSLLPAEFLPQLSAHLTPELSLPTPRRSGEIQSVLRC